MDLHRRPLLEIVHEDFRLASALHHCNISFFQHPESTLEQICRTRGLDVGKVLQRLERRYELNLLTRHRELAEKPLALLIDYLEHVHRMFIRSKLPYLSHLIGHIRVELFDHQEVAKDLHTVFPLFVEEFVEHILEEENHLFGHIRQLAVWVESRRCTTFELFERLRVLSIRDEARRHREEDSEMRGIRLLTDHYALRPDSGTYTKVVYSELQAFEEDLLRHARIENELLFPKAIELEEQACQWLYDRAQGN